MLLARQLCLQLFGFFYHCPWEGEEEVGSGHPGSLLPLELSLKEASFLSSLSSHPETGTPSHTHSQLSASLLLHSYRCVREGGAPGHLLA